MTRRVFKAVATTAVVAGVLGGLLAQTALAQVSLTALDTAYSQPFDTLPASGSATWSNNTTLPGWYHARTGSGSTIVALNGNTNVGNLYSFGTGTATDRALGSIGSGNAAIGDMYWGVRLQNNTGYTITALDVSYFGEQWRDSGTGAQAIFFSYLVGSSVTGSLQEFQTPGARLAGHGDSQPIRSNATNSGRAGNRRVEVTITHRG